MNGCLSLCSILALITIFLGLRFFSSFLALNSMFCETRVLMSVKVKGEQADFEILGFFGLFGLFGFFGIFQDLGTFELWDISGYFLDFGGFFGIIRDY